MESLLRINRSEPMVMLLFADLLHIRSAALVFVSELSWPQCEKSANVGPPRLPLLPRCRFSVFALFDDSACARSILAVAGHTRLGRLSRPFFHWMFISIMHRLQSFPSRRFMSDKSAVTISCVLLVRGAGGESLRERAPSVHG